MTKEKILPVALVGASLTLSGAVYATAQSADAGQQVQDTAQRGDMIIRADHRRGDRDRGTRGMSFRALFIDADGDGSITEDEVALAQNALVAGADLSGEGDISLEEYEAIFLELMRDSLVDSFHELDEDGSGQITSGEMDEAVAELFNWVDRNDDGIIGEGDRRVRGDDA